MSKRKKTANQAKPKKVDLLELSAAKKTRLLNEAKEKLRQQLVEAKFWQSFAETEKVIINGQIINFENKITPELTPEELTAP